MFFSLYLVNDIFKINYSRKNIDEIKPSLFTKIIFTNNELKMRSIKGIAVMLFFMSGLLVEFLLLVFAFIVFLLIRDLKTLKLWELLVFCSFIPMAYLSWVGLFRPLHNLLTHRIIKAPELFLNANIDNADIEMYKGRELWIPREEAQELGEDEYYVADLIGMEVLLENGEKFGVLRDVMETGANDVYIVDRVDGEEILLPAIHDCVLDVDVEKNTMTVHLMKGLV